MDDTDKSPRHMALAVWYRQANQQLDKYVNYLLCYLGIRAKEKIKNKKGRGMEIVGEAGMGRRW